MNLRPARHTERRPASDQVDCHLSNNQLKSLKRVFRGGDSWESRAYDASTASEQKKLLLTLEPKK